MPPTLYDILAVKPAATADEIRCAYRKLARQLHPDKNPAPDSTKKFALVASAYETLSDRSRRRAYDAALERASVKGAGPVEDDDSAPIARRPHFSWVNIASESSDPAHPAASRNGRASHAGPNGTAKGLPRTELDEMYDAFFGSVRPAAPRKKPNTRSNSH